MRVLRSLLATVAIACALLAAPAQAIPRDAVIARAKTWLNAGVPYSQSRWANLDGSRISAAVAPAQASHQGWRTDCSGFVAMCWDLRDSLGRPQSPTTMDYRANPSRWYQIRKDQLQPGDMMLVCAEWGAPYSHAVLFAGWTDGTKTKYWAIEESSSQRGVARRATPYPYWGTAARYYRPFRYRYIQDDFSDVITSVYGGDAFRTAVSASERAFPPTSTATVPGLVVASSGDWTTSLSAASVAAGARGPVLLAAPHLLPASTAAEIVRLKPATVYLLGPTSALDANVEASIAALGPRVVRITAPDRYSIAAEAAAVGADLARDRGTTVDTAFLVNGEDFADAHAASPVAVRASRPVLCTRAGSLPRPTLDALEDLHIRTVVIVGDGNAVSLRVERYLKRRRFVVRRIRGADHAAVSRNLSVEGGRLGLSWDGAALASDGVFTDSLAGGVAQGFSGSIMLLNPSSALDAGVASDISARRARIRPLRIYGGHTGIAWGLRQVIALRLRQP